MRGVKRWLLWWTWRSVALRWRWSALGRGRESWQAAAACIALVATLPCRCECCMHAAAYPTRTNPHADPQVAARAGMELVPLNLPKHVVTRFGTQDSPDERFVDVFDAAATMDR